MKRLQSFALSAAIAASPNAASDSAATMAATVPNSLGPEPIFISATAPLPLPLLLDMPGVTVGRSGAEIACGETQQF